MVEGLIAMRKMHIRAIAESGLTCADVLVAGSAIFGAADPAAAVRAMAAL